MQFLAERALDHWWYLYKSFLQLHSFTPAAHTGCPPGAGLACCWERRHESDTVPRGTHSLEGGQKGGYGEGPNLNQEKVFMKEVVLAQCFDKSVGFLQAEN